MVSRAPRARAVRKSGTVTGRISAADAAAPLGCSCGLMAAVMGYSVIGWWLHGQRDRRTPVCHARPFWQHLRASCLAIAAIIRATQAVTQRKLAAAWPQAGRQQASD